MYACSDLAKKTNSKHMKQTKRTTYENPDAAELSSLVISPDSYSGTSY